MDKYANFIELAQNEREGEDYTILLRESNSKFAIIAPHGGGIEPGTLDLADAVASSDHTFYAFKGIKKTDLFYKFVNTLKGDLCLKPSLKI